MKSVSDLPNATPIKNSTSLELIRRAVEKGQEAALAAMREREQRKEQDLHLFPIRF